MEGSCVVRTVEVLILTTVVYMYLLGEVVCFNPTNNVNPTTSRTHQQITEQSIRNMVRTIMNDYPDEYPDHAVAMASRDFRNALADIMAFSGLPDNDLTMAATPKLHFNSEKIIEGNTYILEERQKLFINVAAGDMTASRQVLGQLLHTLQDFYSHTNWVELGHRSINEALGDPSRVHAIGRVADVEEPTCRNCSSNANQGCENNILNNILVSNRLTSGYVTDNISGGSSSDRESHESNNVPPGKCSHGHLGDGINKDSESEITAPHYQLHQRAADLAEGASYEFLKQTREVLSDKEFAALMGLHVGASLCFIVDTTGSMSDEIAGVRDYTIDLTEKRAHSNAKPSDYVLSPFNDPDTGPVTKTTDADEMVAALRRLWANGGGDTPELFFAGVIAALNNVRPGSECYAFTDAPPKDVDLLQTSIQIASEKRVKINVVDTSAFGRKKRDLQKSIRRQKRQTGYDVYAELARATGGVHVITNKGDINEVLSIIDTKLATVQVLAVKVDNIMGTGTPQLLDVPLDNTMTDVVITVTSSRSSLANVDVTDPEGISAVRTTHGTDFTKVTGLSQLKIYTIGTPAPGLWSLGITTAGQFSVSVNARSLLDFSYQFVELTDFGHVGYRPVQGRPRQGVNTTMLVHISDLTSNETWTLRDLVLFAENGQELQRFPVQVLQDGVMYTASAVLPSEGFRVGIEGTDRSGNKIQRLDVAVVHATQVIMRISSGAVGVYTVNPGDVLTVNLTVTNYASTSAYEMSSYDRKNFVQSIMPSTLTLATNETGSVVVTLSVPLNAPTGQVTTVSVTTTSTRHTSDENFVVFRITTVSPIIDRDPPVCTIVDRVGNCSETAENSLPCEEEEFYIAFVSDDAGSGLHVIRPADMVQTASFSLDGFTRGTTGSVRGNYTSTCCHPRVTIVASDALGNSARCSVDYIPITTTTTRATTTPFECLDRSAALEPSLLGLVCTLVLSYTISGLTFSHN